MGEQRIFVLAEEALKNVIDQIDGGQWEQLVPSDFPTYQVDRRFTLREIVAYYAYDDAWVPDMLAGRTMEEAGKDKFDGDLLGGDPKGGVAEISRRACEAAENLADEDLERTVHCSFGDFSAREYFWQINSFRALRAVDIARVIGADETLPAELVQGIWDEISPHAEQWRQLGVYGPAVEVAGDAPLQERLLGLTGRRPRG